MRSIGISVLVCVGVIAGVIGGCSALGQSLNPSWCLDHPTEADCVAYCMQHPADPNCANATDGGIDGPDAFVGCQSDLDCVGSASGSACDLASHLCEQCTSGSAGSNALACVGDSPVCGSADTCRACEAHTECSSDACLADGSCADTANVAYVSPTGTGSACTQVAPCGSFLNALATGRPYIKATGALTEQVSIASQNVTILADPGASLTEGAAGVILTISGSSNVAIYDLTITGALGSTSVGISLSAGNTATVDLERVTVTGGAGVGISTAGGTLSLVQSTISSNTGGGISVTGTNPALVISRSTIDENTGGGISIAGTGPTFDITNSFIYRNGDQDNSTFGGLSLTFATAGSNRLEFNTITDNRAAASAFSGGVICNVSTFSAPNNIIARNSLNGSTTATGAQTFGACTYPTSAVANDVTGLAFVNSDGSAGPSYDYHIGSTSTAIDKATTPTSITIDFDGQMRPDGSADDQGADEYWP